jgi:hypothetical protein
MDTLVSLGVSAAMGYSITALLARWPGHLFFTESVTLLTLVGIGHFLEARMSARAGNALRDLLGYLLAGQISLGTFAWLIALLEGVEDIPGTALAEGLTWDWESFPDYLDALGRRAFALDVAAHLPHAALRTYVMGDRGGDHREHPTEAEIAEMARLTEEALAAGALGFTTSRTFDFLRDRLGLAPAALAELEHPLEVAERVVPSPFDYGTQTLLAVPTDLPAAEAGGEPFQEATARVVADVARLSDGGLFVLFTSHAALSDADRVALGIPAGFVRLSVGVEDVEDLKADFAQALEGAGS